MIRSDRSARGGAAARLLAAEKELCRITADATETHSVQPLHLVSSCISSRMAGRDALFSMPVLVGQDSKHGRTLS